VSVCGTESCSLTAKRESEGETAARRKRIGGGGELRREGWTVRGRDRAEESVKLQQQGDKSFSLPLPASASERGIKQSTRRRSGRSRLPAATAAPGFSSSAGLRSQIHSWVRVALS